MPARRPAASGPDSFRLLIKERGWSERGRLERLSRMLELMVLGQRSCR